MLPTFLGIGVPRSGTTWLHDLLDTHPDVLMARRRKEVQFFNQHYARGLDWYESFFPACDPAPKAIGDFTPGYLFDPDVPARVAAVASIDRFVVSFRDPIERLVSHYQNRSQQDRFRGSLEEFVGAYPHILEQGRYATYFEPWLERFGRRRFLALVFESAVRDVTTTKRRLAEHLDVDSARFPAGAGAALSNVGFVPRHARAHAATRRAARFLRRHDIDWGHRVGARLRGARRHRPHGSTAVVATAVTPALRAQLIDLYRPEAQRLSAMIGQPLEHWSVLRST